MRHLKVMVHQSGCPERDSLRDYDMSHRLAVLQMATPLSIQKRGHSNFPAAGYRNNSSGTSINNVTSNGYCWSSSANSSTNGRNLNLNSSNFNWNNNNRANGFSVRPVLEAFSDRRLFFSLIIFFISVMSWS